MTRFGLSPRDAYRCFRSALDRSPARPLPPRCARGRASCSTLLDADVYYERADRAAQSDRLLRRPPAGVRRQHADQARRSARPASTRISKSIFARGIDPEAEAAAVARGNPAWPSREAVRPMPTRLTRSSRKRSRRPTWTRGRSPAAARRAGGLGDSRARGDAPGDARLHVASAARTSAKREAAGIRHAAATVADVRRQPAARLRFRPAARRSGPADDGAVCLGQRASGTRVDVAGVHHRRGQRHQRANSWNLSRRAAIGNPPLVARRRLGVGAGGRRDASLVLDAARATGRGTGSRMFERGRRCRPTGRSMSRGPRRTPTPRWRGERLLTEAELHRALRQGTAPGQLRLRSGGIRCRSECVVERQRFRRPRSGGQRMGVDLGRLRAISRVHAAAVVSGVLGRLLRRSAFRHEGRVTGDRSRPLVRPGFRNWFRPRYPYVYATFRCVSR